MSVHQALRLYETFNAKQPELVTALDPEIQYPSTFGAVAITPCILYASHKWRQDEDQRPYVHRYTTRVELVSAWQPGMPRRRLVLGRELVQLGQLLELEVVPLSGKRDPSYLVPSEPTLVCSTADGRSLVLLAPAGFVAALVGRSQRITERGIEG